MANYPVYPYGGYQPPYYPQPMQGQINPIPQTQQMTPQMLQQPQAAQPISQNAPASQVTPMLNQSNGIVWVNSRAEADNYLVAPGNAVALWDANDPLVYLRQADNTGKPSTTVYELVERDPGKRQDPKKEMQLPDFSQFLKREEVEKVVEEMVENILSGRLKKTSKSVSKKEDD